MFGGELLEFLLSLFLKVILLFLHLPPLALDQGAVQLRDALAKGFDKGRGARWAEVFLRQLALHLLDRILQGSADLIQLVKLDLLFDLLVIFGEDIEELLLR